MFPETQRVSGLMERRCRPSSFMHRPLQAVRHSKCIVCPATSLRSNNRGVLLVEFAVMGIPCLGLNGGLQLQYSEACSFQVASDDQAETDRRWHAH